MNNPDSTIVHFDLDSFFVSVERLLNPGLIGKPVIVGGLSDRGVVASCSYEARKFGVHSAMPVKMALNLCREAIVVRGNMDLYTEKSKIVTRIIADQAPLYEKASIDEHYLIQVASYTMSLLRVKAKINITSLIRNPLKVTACIVLRNRAFISLKDVSIPFLICSLRKVTQG